MTRDDNKVTTGRIKSFNFTDDAKVDANKDISKIIESKIFVMDIYEDSSDEDKKIYKEKIKEIIKETENKIKDFGFSSYFKRLLYKNRIYDNENEGDGFEDISTESYLKEIKKILKNNIERCGDELKSGNTIKAQSIGKWIEGTAEPKRKSVLALGFALGLSLEDIEKELIQKGKGESGINYKDIEERAFAFCIKNNLEYSDYTEIINSVKKYIKDNIENVMMNLSPNQITGYLKDHYKNLSDINDFIDVFTRNINDNIVAIKNVLISVVNDCETEYYNAVPDARIKNYKGNERKKKIKNLIERKEEILKYIEKNNIYIYLLEKSRDKKLSDEYIKMQKIQENENEHGNKKRTENEDTIKTLEEAFKEGIIYSFSDIDSNHNKFWSIIRFMFPDFITTRRGAYRVFDLLYDEIRRSNVELYELYVEFAKIFEFDMEDLGTFTPINFFNEYALLSKDFNEQENKEKKKKSVKGDNESLKKFLSAIFDNGNKSKAGIMNGSNNVIRNQIIILAMVKFIIDDGVKSKGIETKVDFIKKRQDRFYRSVYSLLKEADMHSFNLAKPFDYLAYMCFSFMNPEQAFKDIIFEIFDIDSIEYEIAQDEKNLKAIISRNKFKMSDDQKKLYGKFSGMLNHEILYINMCIGRVYFKENMFDKSWGKYEICLQILTKIIEYNDVLENLNYSGLKNDFVEVHKKIYELIIGLKKFITENKDKNSDAAIKEKVNCCRELYIKIYKYIKKEYPELRNGIKSLVSE